MMFHPDKLKVRTTKLVVCLVAMCNAISGRSAKCDDCPELQNLLTDYQKIVSVHCVAKRSGSVFIRDPAGSSFKSNYEFWYTFPGYRIHNVGEGGGLFNTDIRYDGNVVQIYNERSGILYLRHNIFALKPGDTYNILLLPFIALGAESPSNRGCTIAWTDLVPKGVIATNLAKVQRAATIAGDLRTYEMPDSFLNGVSCKYLIHISGEHSLPTKIEAFSKSTGTKLATIDLVYSKEDRAAASTFFVNQCDVDLFGADGKRVLKYTQNLEKIEINGAVSVDDFTSDYQKAKWITDLDTNEWIKSPHQPLSNGSTTTKR